MKVRGIFTPEQIATHLADVVTVNKNVVLDGEIQMMVLAKGGEFQGVRVECEAREVTEEDFTGFDFNEGDEL